MVPVPHCALKRRGIALNCRASFAPVPTRHPVFARTTANLLISCRARPLLATLLAGLSLPFARAVCKTGVDWTCWRAAGDGPDFDGRLSEAPGQPLRGERRSGVRRPALQH